MELNVHLEGAYKKLLKIFSEQDNNIGSIYYIHFEFYSAMSDLNHWAVSAEEKAFVRQCELKMLPYYQKALEKHYQDFKKQKDIGYPDYSVINSWTLTVDKNGTPTKTTVVDVQQGLPIYADGCIGVNILNDARDVGNCRYELNKWLKPNGNLYELKVEAMKLKYKGRMGMSEPPTPNYDLSGLVGGQLDAAAWQNYAIEHGMVRRTDYDETLDKLLTAIDKCIDFYEKAISIV